MHDLISRQAAIEALEEMQMPIMQSIFPEEQFVFKGMSEALSAIKELPSAQPEIIRCKDCKWWDKYNEKRGYCMAAKHGFMSSHWEIGIYRIYDEEFFCADAEPKGKEGGDDEQID